MERLVRPLAVRVEHKTPNRLDTKQLGSPGTEFGLRLREVVSCVAKVTGRDGQELAPDRFGSL